MELFYLQITGSEIITTNAVRGLVTRPPDWLLLHYTTRSAGSIITVRDADFSGENVFRFSLSCPPAAVDLP